MTTTLRWLACLSLPLGSGAACAHGPLGEQAPIVTDRPDFTESAEVVARGVVQVEGGVTTARTEGARATAVGEVLVRVGVAPRVEGRLALNSYTVSRNAGVRSAGFEDALVGTKVQLAEGNGAAPTLAVLAATTLPTGGNAWRNARLQPEVKLAAAWDLSERVSWSSNVNHSWLRAPSTTVSEWGLSGSLGIGLAPRTASYIEYFGFYPTAHGNSSHYLDGGLTYLLNGNVQLDARAGVGVGRSAGDYFVGVGISRRFTRRPAAGAR